MHYRNHIYKMSLSHGAVITQADFCQTYFSQIDWEDSVFTNCDFSNSFFEGYSIKYCKFINCNFSNVLWSSFREAHDATFEGCCFVGSNFPEQVENQSRLCEDGWFDDACFWQIEGRFYDGVWKLSPITLGDKKKK